MVVLPVFLQAPWVRLDPFSATLFTGVLVAAGLVMHQSRSQTTSDLGSLLVGFSGSWLAGCIFWGWLRAHPVLHLPGSLRRARGLGRPAGALAPGGNVLFVVPGGHSLHRPGHGGHRRDAVLARSGDSLPRSSAATAASSGDTSASAPALVTLVISAVLVLLAGRRLSRNSGGFTGEAGSMAAAVLITTLWVDGLFLLSALLQPGLSGLIE